MKFSEKIRLFFIPFLLINIGYAAIIAVACWVLMTRYPVWGVYHGFEPLLLMIFLPVVPLFFLLRPVLRPIPGTANKKSKWWLYAVCWGGLSMIGLGIHDFMQKTTGKLMPLDHISDITRKPVSKYYTCRHFYIDKDHAGSYKQIRRGTSKSRYNTLEVDIAMPIWDSIADTSAATAVIWYGKEYAHSVPKSHDPATDSIELADYERECFAKFDTADYTRFDHLELYGGTGFRDDDYTIAMSSTGKYKGQEVKILLPVDSPYDQRYSSTLSEVCEIVLAYCLLWLLLLYFTRVGESEDEASLSTKD